jgi:gas vesicle protein
MQDENDDSVWPILAGVAIGVAVGGVLGILFAPKPGAELREELRDKAEQALDDLQNATHTLSERSKDLVAQTRENLAESIEAGKSAYSKKRDELTAQIEA